MSYRVGQYVYDITDKEKKNLLILGILAKHLWVYCMKRHDKFMIPTALAKLTPIPWKE